jgi:hypothetical protein
VSSALPNTTVLARPKFHRPHRERSAASLLRLERAVSLIFPRCHVPRRVYCVDLLELQGREVRE